MVSIMKNKNIVSVLCLLTSASIAGGMAFENFFEYSMIIGAGLATVFIVAAGFSLGKRNKVNNSHH